MSFSISTKYKNTDWLALNIIDENSANWNNGILIIEDRFNSRFFNQIDLIKKDKSSGFLVMSIDCLLIETSMQFYLGIESTDISYNEQWKSFRDFLKNSNHFKTDFSTSKLCKTFYKDFRCGLLHQAQTKNKSLIKINQSNFLVLADPNKVEEGLIIDRKQFHEKMVLEFEDYIERLKNNEDNFLNQNLRTNALQKMNLICS